MSVKLLHKVENIVTKGEIALFATIVFKSGLLQKRLYVEIKGLIK